MPCHCSTVVLCSLVSSTCHAAITLRQPALADLHCVLQDLGHQVRRGAGIPAADLRAPKLLTWHPGSAALAHCNQEDADADRLAVTAFQASPVMQDLGHQVRSVAGIPAADLRPKVADLAP